MKSESNEKENKENLKDDNDFKDSATNESSPWGYDLYPERRGAKYKPSLVNIFFGVEGREDLNRTKCERNVFHVYRNSRYMLFFLIL